MVVSVNGEHRELPSGATVETLLELLDGPEEGRGVAVAVDGEVVPRGVWSGTALADGAQVEIVAAVQGG